MEEKEEKKENPVPAQKAPYEKPQLNIYGTMENIALATNHKVSFPQDAHSGIGKGAV